ncbi:MAG: hypothetical protein CW691_05930 [Candidatus Bathyarchaeum sp.]|nr:MAG: hypothetical protein CW691_05930 [Candidatus Bathyarchaeum sp.]
MTRYHPVNLKIARNIFVIFLVALVLISIPQSAAASDPPPIDWRKTYSGIQATSVIQTSDGGYAIAGTATFSDGVSLIKCDSSGNIQWQKNLGNVISIEETKDLAYVVFLENGDVTKLDTQGNVLSTFSVGAKGVRQGIIAVDGDYIVTGNGVWQYSETYVWLRKFDPQGNMVWNLNYTGGFKISSIAYTVDRGCVLAGNWKNNFWLARLDSNGNQQWSQNYVYGDPADAHYVYAVDRTDDGGFILSGTGMWQSSGGMIPWLIKINSQGYEQWNLPYAQYRADSFTSIVQTADNGYFVVRPRAANLMGADSSGSEIWQTPLGTSSITEVQGYPAACLIPTKDGGYALAGSTSENAFLLKFSPQATSQPPTVSILSPQSTTHETHEIPLTFIVNDQNAQFSYVLDGQPEVTIAGNTTLTNLPVGPHNITVYAHNSAGLTGVSEVILFTIADRFPSEILFAGIATVVAVGVSFLLYLKRQSLSNFKKGDLKGILKNRHRPAFMHNKLVWTLLIIVICFILVFVQFFLPYAYYSSSYRASNSFEVGITYVYERDDVDQVYSEVSHLKDLGFTVIRVNLVCDSMDANSILNTLSNVFFSAVRQLGMKVALIINAHETMSDISYYLDRWGSDLSYIQILNEPDVASSWEMGALFTDDEAGSKFEDIYTIVEQHQLPAQLYTNFSPAFIVRTNLPIEFSEKLDFVGFDVFMDSFLTISPNMIQYLQKITNKDVVISEFGMSTSNDAEQSTFIINGLNLFRNMGLKGCWIVYWNDADNHYGIRGRLAEQTVGEWIAQNV